VREIALAVRVLLDDRLEQVERSLLVALPSDPELRSRLVSKRTELIGHLVAVERGLKALDEDARA
jgi:hypothetical protein